MFRLEKLELNGFKSFADRTTLLFGEGITAVVGPNGCGKSNVAEGISWVLGEQSAKNLRGGKMEDVIFNGTRDRKPTGMAEVLLTLVAIEDIVTHDQETTDKDDEGEYEEALASAERAASTARALVQEMTPAEAETASAEPKSAPSPQPTTQGDASASHEDASAGVKETAPTAHLELPAAAAEQAVAPINAEAATPQTKRAERPRSYHRRKRVAVAISAGERITVARRLYRTGDSDYLMNGRPCLLRDIQDLFAGTGLGGAHYAIVEQGRIGQILSSKPLDRRGLIEEAAGITKFKSRKRSAELKLESAKQNLTRLNDIISEVERQVNSLKRQAQKARRYRRLRDEMRALLKIVFTADYYRLNDAIERVARELEDVEASTCAVDGQLAERETEHRVVSSEARTAEDALTGLREQASAVELEADRARNRRAFDERQMAEITARIQEINRDQEALESRLGLLEDNAQQRASASAALDKELVGEQAELLRHEGEYQQELAQLREAESEIEQLRQRMLTEIGVTERLRNLSASLEEALRKLDLKQTNLRAEMERAGTRLDDASSEHARASQEVEQDTARLAELTERIRERAENLMVLRNEIASRRAQLEDLRTERAAAEHRMASLEDLDAHHAYYSDTVQQVLSPEQAARINALGTLADFVEVEAAYEKLIESLFGRELQSMLVPTIDDALAGVEFIKSESLGRGAFLVVGLHGGEDEPEEGGRMAQDALRAARPGAGGQEEIGNAEMPHTSGIEQWLLDSEAASGKSQFNDEYIPIERQLPPADFAFTEPLAAFPEDVYSLPLADEAFDLEDIAAREETEAAARLEQQAQERRFDEDEYRASSRFQLDVLRAIDLLNMRHEIKSVVERAFPDKCAAAVVPDIEAALQLSIENPSLVYVTYEGEQVVNGRLIVTGAQAGKQGTSLLGLKREIKQLRVQTVRRRNEEGQLAASLALSEAKPRRSIRNCASTRRPPPRAIRNSKGWRAISNARRNTCAWSKPN